MMRVVFDVGNVLIAWAPHLAFAHRYPDRAEAEAWMARVGFHAWNYAQDGGRTLAEGLAVARAEHGALADPLADYVARFDETIRTPIAGSWALIEALRARGAPVYAITNFGAETWPAALARYPAFGTHFADIVVSGHERILKPDPAIYRLLLDRNGLAAGDCLFVDDVAANVEGARAVGMAAHHFTGPEALAAELTARGIL
ncbi:MAG: HAD family hydrolase [Gemmobacter sp.]